MKLTNKKIIAREFLILIVILFLSLLSFLSTYLYNYYFKIQSNNITLIINEKSNLSSKLSSAHNNKIKQQKWFHSKILEEFNLNENPEYTREKIWEKLVQNSQKDSINIKWSTIWSEELTPFFKKVGFNSPEELKAFIDNNILNFTDITNKDNATKIMKEVNSLRWDKKAVEKNILTLNQQIDVSVYIFSILMVFFFPVRYLIISIIWSIKTLKIKE